MGTAAFVERVRAREADARAGLGTLADRLGVDVDLDAGRLDHDAFVVAARTAFVRLFEAGLLTCREEVVDTCPTCASVVDGDDREPADVESEAVVVRLAESLEITTDAPEMLAAALAVVIPDGSRFEGTHVEVPIAGREVPVVRDAGVSDPLLLAPADGDSQLLARKLGLTPVELCDVDGIARPDGPLDGLPRFAARTAARDLLAAEGVVVGTEAVSSAAWRCRYCRTVLVPRLARQWMLDTAAFGLDGAGASWCISRDILGGEAIPAATCRDCGRVSVGVGEPTSCPYCMSRDLHAEPGVLDAAFVAAVWPLAAHGWPWRAPAGNSTLVTTWSPGAAQRAIALGTWLAGIPTVHEVVLVSGPGPDGADVIDPDALDEVAREVSPRVVRTALLRRGLDVAEAGRLVAAFEDPPAFSVAVDIDATEKAFHAAMAAGQPADGLSVLDSALRDGAGQDHRDRIRRLAEPLWGRT